jgi:hypothetical protein
VAAFERADPQERRSRCRAAWPRTERAHVLLHRRGRASDDDARGDRRHGYAKLFDRRSAKTHFALERDELVADDEVSRQYQVQVAELVPEVAVLERGPIGALEELDTGRGLEQLEM